MQISGTKEKERYLKKMYDEYYHRLCFYALKYVRDVEEAKDIVQEIFVKIWEQSLLFKNEAALSTYLYNGVYHTCLNRINAQDIHARHHQYIKMINDEHEYANYVNDRIEREVLWEVLMAIDSLPEECRKVIKLSYLEGNDIARVAELLNISEHTVKSQRARGKKLLQERLKNLYSVFVILFLS